MTIIDIPDLCNAKPSDGKYKELALKFFDTIEKKYGIKLKDPSKGKEVFKSVNVMAKFIADNRTK